MGKVAKLITMNNAYDDLVTRTLYGMKGDLARLIYLASTRDYNSGIYHHEGLAARYGSESARVALRAAHKDIFYRLVSLSLEELAGELESYVRVSRETPTQFIHAWQELEPYRVSVPMDIDPTMVQLFLSNIKLALEILQVRRARAREHQSASSPLPSLGQ
jgi:hypothetical protein